MKERKCDVIRGEKKIMLINNIKIQYRKFKCIKEKRKGSRREKEKETMNG